PPRRLSGLRAFYGQLSTRETGERHDVPFKHIWRRAHGGGIALPSVALPRRSEHLDVESLAHASFRTLHVGRPHGHPALGGRQHELFLGPDHKHRLASLFPDRLSFERTAACAYPRILRARLRALEHAQKDNPARENGAPAHT